MLLIMEFHLSGKVIALYLDSNTAKGCLCNQEGKVSPFLFRLVCCILNLDHKHGITLIPAYRDTHLNVEVDYLSGGRLVPGWCVLPHIALVVFQL